MAYRIQWTAPTTKSGAARRAAARRTAMRRPGDRDREGSTLLIVMVLLGMLSLVGFLFYTFAAGERSAATYFADAHKDYSSADADMLIEFGLQQLIVGPDPSLTQSALYGGRHSLIPNMFGRDIYTYNSEGIHLGSNGGLPFVDMNRNGVADDQSFAADDTDGDTATDETPLNNEPLEFNDSGSAQGWINAGGQFVPARDLTNWPDPGVDYTYPDINNVFLAYNGFAVDSSGNTVPVVIPSFHRPQLLRNAGGLPSPTWYSDAAFARRVMRPHPSHLNPNGTPRFPTSTAGTTLTSVFPFSQASNQGVWSLTTPYAPGMNITYQWDVDNDNDSLNTAEGIWLDLNHPVQTTATGEKYVPLYSFTVYDADGLFNLNAHGNHAHLSQLQASPGTNTIGDLAFNAGAGTALPVDASGTTRHLSGSNQGLTPFEVNPQIAFYADPTTYTGSLAQYAYQFGAAPANFMQGANMDWYRLLTGTASFQSATTFNDLYAGRYGEANSWLYGALMQGITGSGAAAAAPVTQMPFPGVTGFDDNWNRFEGQFSWERRSTTPGVSQLSPFALMYNPATPLMFPSSTAFYAQYPYGNPLDFNADGTVAMTGSLGKSRLSTYYNSPTGTYSVKYPQYVNYDNPGAVLPASPAGTSDTTNLNSVAAGWRPNSLQGAQMVDRAGVPLLPGTPPATLIDEPLETTIEPSSASEDDSIFREDEAAALQLSLNDRNDLSLSSRTGTLAPLNLNNNIPPYDTIPQRFTPLSWDRRQYGLAGAATDVSYKELLPLPDTSRSAAIDNMYGDRIVYRPWELSDLDGDFVRESFPPAIYDTTNGAYLVSTNANLPVNLRRFDPFRAPVRRLLQATIGSQEWPPAAWRANRNSQFRLSLNHLTTTDVPFNDFSGNVIQRSLTPHDANLTAAQVTPGSQEDLARRDRQQMARDIYVMLYMLGGGLDFSVQNGHIGPISPYPAPPPNGYPLNHPNHGYLGDNSPDGSGNRNLYSDRQLREMAQFAVNVVDALDPDHVITKFEYDKNLADGWGELGTGTLLDDDPYTNEFTPYVNTHQKYDPAYPEESDQRGVVYGVEAQEMTFSEVLAFQCPKMQVAGNPSEHQGTAHSDTMVRYFTYVELRNISPNDIDFGATQCWRLRAICKNNTLNAYGGEQRYVKFTGGIVAASDVFTMGNAGETDGGVPLAPNHSRFICANSLSGDPNVDATDPTTWIAPSSNYAKAMANGGFPDLDLLAHRDQLGLYRFQLVDVGGTLQDVSDDVDITNMSSPGGDGAGRFFNDNTLFDPTYMPDATATLDAKNASNQEVTFILERRQYPDRPPPAFDDPVQNNDNPWVPVDFVRLPQLNRFNLQPTDTTLAQLDAALLDLQSDERNEPLFNAQTPHAQAIVANSLMNENSMSTTNPFTYWQVTYDRPFASPVELLQIPLYGPMNVTRWLARGFQSAKAQAQAFPADFATESASLPYGGGLQISVPTAATAAGKILLPEDESNLGLAPALKVPVNDNRWYRLFEFFEVPTRMHRQLGNPLDRIRTPGKLNLNGIRHPDVLAGLLDDADLLNFQRNFPPSPNPLNVSERSALLARDPSDADGNMSSTAYAIPAVRDWWVQFLQARDGRLMFTAGDVDVNGNGVVRNAPDNVTQLFLPGLADSSPFRSFASLGHTRIAGSLQSPTAVVDQTVFRRLPLDVNSQPSGGDPTTDPLFDVRHLWEVGNATDHTNGNVDPVMRDRLLSKIYNNVTTRSHVFFVFATVQFFQADDTNGSQNVQIGGPLSLEPEYRGFFVIDRSKPEDAYDAGTGRFTNYRSLIKYRLRIK